MTATRTHTDWDTETFNLPVIARLVGPFAGREMLTAWHRTLGTGDVVLLENAGALVPLEQTDATFRLLGETDLFDYHSPRGEGVSELVADWSSQLPAGTSIDFDSLPAEAADILLEGLRLAGLRPVAEVHESAAVLDVTGDYESYLASLDKKQRHETRRKTRRFTEILGPPRLVRTSGKIAVAQFAAMHRLADGRKGQFMTETMEAMFGDFHADAGAVIDFLHGDGDEPVAAAFGFEDESAYYLYNSAYQPSAAAASPGIVLVAELIKRTSEAAPRRFDFLKGDEVYKYRLGATARPLWRIRATVGSGTA